MAGLVPRTAQRMPDDSTLWASMVRQPDAAPPLRTKVLSPRKWK
jgi:hypothetical protein